MNDEQRLRDILEFGVVAQDLAAGGVAVLEKSLVRRLALERALFIVGEASAALDSATRARIAVPWRDIIGLRNILAHRYEAVEANQLVLLAKRNLPGFIDAIRQDLKRFYGP